MKKYKGITSMCESGTKILLGYIVYSTIYNEDEDFFNEDIGQNILTTFEDISGLTYNVIKKLVMEKKNRNYDELKSSFIEDLKTMTLTQIAKKHNIPRNCLKNYFTRNNIKFLTSTYGKTTSV